MIEFFSTAGFGLPDFCLEPFASLQSLCLVYPLHKLTGRNHYHSPSKEKFSKEKAHLEDSSTR
jgi:hypothetical protein